MNTNTQSVVTLDVNAYGRAIAIARRDWHCRLRSKNPETRAMYAGHALAMLRAARMMRGEFIASPTLRCRK